MDFTFIGNDRAGNRLDQGALAGTVVADHGKDLSRHQIEIAMIEGGYAAVALDEIAAFEKRFHQTATFLIHWSTATAAMMSTPMSR